MVLRNVGGRLPAYTMSYARRRLEKFVSDRLERLARAYHRPLEF